MTTKIEYSRKEVRVFGLVLTMLIFIFSVPHLIDEMKIYFNEGSVNPVNIAVKRQNKIRFFEDSCGAECGSASFKDT